MDGVLRALANPIDQEILTALAVEDAHPRGLAQRLSRPESEVSRRLRRLERSGLVNGRWEHRGRNVRLYRLTAGAVQVNLTPTGLVARIAGRAAERRAQPGRPLPPPPAHGFVGRSDDLASLASGASVVLVEGLPGIGKTSLLARHAAAQNDVLWITFRGGESLAWLAHQAALHAEAHGEDAALLRGDEAALAASLLDAIDKPHRTTMLDDVHRIDDDGLRGFVADAVARVSQGRLLVAGRERVPHAPRPGLLVHRLEGMTDDDVAAFLAAKGMDTDEETRRLVRDEVGGHPLALNLLAEAAGDRAGLRPLLDRRPEEALSEYLLEQMDAHLSETERLALHHASTFPHTFSRADVEALSGRRLEGALLSLRRRLLVQGSDERMRLHEVVRNHFYSRLEDHGRLHRKAAERCLARETVDGHLEALHHFLAAGDKDRVRELLRRDLDVKDLDFVDAGYRRIYSDLLDLFSPTDVDARLWGQICDEKGDLAMHAGDVAAAATLYGDAARSFKEAGDEAAARAAAAKRAVCRRRLTA